MSDGCVAKLRLQSGSYLLSSVSSVQVHALCKDLFVASVRGFWPTTFALSWTAILLKYRPNPELAFLACAFIGEADYLVTGDKDLLVLREIGPLKIVSPTQFRELLETG